MKTIKCQCPGIGKVPKKNLYKYNDNEKPFVNHKPNECKCTNELKQYRRGKKKLWLCSCCNLFSDVEIKTRVKGK